MAGESLGQAWYELGLRDDEFRAKTRKAEDTLRDAGKAGGDAFGKGVEGGTRKAGTSVDDLVSKLNTLRGKGPDELAAALQRATTEADEASGAVKRLVEADNLDTAKARKYADQLNEISIEADQSAADLRELQASDPKFDTPELQRAASELDRVGREAREGADQLNQLKGVGADTHLERMGQEANEAATSLDKTGKASDGLMGKLKSVKGLLVGLGLAISAQQVLSFFGDTLEAASDLEARTLGATRVLGDHIDVLHDFAATSAEAWGLSKRSVMETGAVLHAQLTNLGFDHRAAAEDVVGLQKRAADMAATFGGPVSGAVLAISAVLRGERDTIEKYGVSLKEADVQARILSLGLDTSTSDAKKNATAIASLDLVMEQTADTAGAFADSQGTAAGETARNTASVEDLKAAIGDQLQPVVTGFLTWVREDGIPIIYDLIGAWNDANEAVARFSDFAGGNMRHVEAIAAALGISYMEARALVVTANQEMGQSAEELREQVERQTDPTIKAAWANARAAADALLLERPRLQTEAAASAAVNVREIEARWADVRAAAFQSAVEHAKGVLDGQNQIKVAFAALTQLQEEEQTRAQRISYLKGLLNSQELQSGLNDGRPGVRGAAAAVRGEITAELASLGVNAYSYGANAGQSLADGLWTKYGVVRTAAGGLAGAIAGQIGIRSEPTDPSSPLRGVTKFGGNIVDTVSGDIIDHLGTALAASRALAGALSLDPLQFGGGSSAALAGAGGGGWHGELTVRVEGAGGPVDRTVADAIRGGVSDALNLSGMTEFLRHEAGLR